MNRVETKYHGNAMLFIKRNGTRAVHPYEFNHKGIDYYLLGGVYYDLDDDLINRIFGG